MSCLVIFDFDGPLFNSRAPRDRAMARTYEHYREQIGLPTHDYAADPLYQPSKMIALAYAGFDLAQAARVDVEQYYRACLVAEEAREPADPRTVETVDALHRLGFCIAVLSMRRVQPLIAMLERLRLMRYVGAVSGRDTEPFAKPDPRALDALLAATNGSAAKSMLVGDTDVDLSIAEARGLAYFHAGWSSEPSARSGSRSASFLTEPGELITIARTGFADTRSDPLLGDQLIATAKENSFSFVVGAGASIASGMGSWESTYGPILGRYCPAPVVLRKSWPEVAQLAVAVESDGRSMFDAFKASFSSHRRSPTEYHFSMMRSRCQTIWTTNYDDLFEKASVLTDQVISIVKDDAQLKDRFGAGRLLIKVHGDFVDAVYDPQSPDWGVVVSEEQMNLSEHSRSEIWRYFEDEYRTSTLIFVGISFNDPTLKQILSIVSRKVMRTRRPHFVLTVSADNPTDRYILARNRELLRRRDIHTIVFPNYDELKSFVMQLCFVSRRPVVAFSGSTHFRTADQATDISTNTLLDGGQLTIERIEDICAEMGHKLAGLGCRVISAHGRGVGIPAVVAAYRFDRRLGRFFMRSEGTTTVTRQAPSIYVAGSNLDDVRRQFVDASHVLIAVGGASKSHQTSGTLEETRMAIERGVPVLLMPQAGGSVHGFWETCMTLIERSSMAAPLRDEVLEANKRLKGVEPERLGEYLEVEFTSTVVRLLNKVIASATSRNFDEAVARADEEWWG